MEKANTNASCQCWDRVQEQGSVNWDLCHKGRSPEQIPPPQHVPKSLQKPDCDHDLLDLCPERARGHPPLLLAIFPKGFQIPRLLPEHVILCMQSNCVSSMSSVCGAVSMLVTIISFEGCIANRMTADHQLVLGKASV